MKQGSLISIIGANGIGKSNILSAVEKAFTGCIDDKRDNPKIEVFINCKPEISIFIETDEGIIYKGNAQNKNIVWTVIENKDLYDIVLKKNYIYKILNYIFKSDDEVYKDNELFYIYKNNYNIDNNIKTDNNEEENFNDILDYSSEKILDIISKYKENQTIDKLKLLISILKTEYYELDKWNNYYNILLDEDKINNSDLQYLTDILIKIDGIENSQVYVHKNNIKSDELVVSCYKKNENSISKHNRKNNSKNFIKESNFLYSLFKSANNMEMYEYISDNYSNILSDVAFAKQTENEINKILENTISKRFNDLYISNNELYKSNSDYSFKISLEKEFIKIYFESKNGLTNLENESEGFNWFFSLFFNTLNYNEFKKVDIIIIDEPEQHLSVPVIKELREFLKQFAKDNGVTIITSVQIPYFADINYLDELKIAEIKQDGIGIKIENDFSATYGKSDTLEKIINAFGIKHIDITRDTKLIYVEGITDYNYFTAFKILMEYIENKEIDIAFMPINGIGRENDEKQKNIIIEGLCNISKNPSILIDGDNSANQFKELAKNTNLKVTQLTDINTNFVTIEDLFSEKDKQIYKIDKKNKDALYSSLFKNNIIDYYNKELISKKTIDNFFKVINEID
ncbi:ATP-binding protein [Brachyspira murdochii]|uniref:ATP-binding protein n=1 Tax=Brachyspira murdochii TaxID=84378 RepID=UPI003007330B